MTMISRWAMFMAVLVASALCPVSAQGTSESAASLPTAEQLRSIDRGGHFYLHGVMEVGSELLLHPDGRFEWIMMYGAVNLRASGQWHRDGRFVVLETETDAPDAPAQLEGFSPWNEDAERQLVAYQHKQRRQAVMKRCPFVAAPAPVSSTPRAGADKPPPAGLMNRAGRAARRLEAAAAVVESAARDFVESNGAELQLAAATEAMHDYQSALAGAKDAHRAAGVDFHSIELDLPARCRLPQRPDDKHFDDPSSWQRGVGVRVVDAETRMSFSGVPVVFRFSDGTAVEGVTNRAGWVVRPVEAAPLSSIEVALPNGAPPLKLDVLPARAEPIAVIDVNLSVLSPPPFETMRLRIDGEDLIPTGPSGDGRGRYSR